MVETPVRQRGTMIIVNRARLFSSTARMDEQSFEVAFHEHYTRVYGILFRLTGEPHEADDLAAETFWRLWERPPARDENLSGWLYRVASRLGYNALRGRKRREQYEIEAGKHMLEQYSPADPAQEVERLSDQAQVRDVLRRMPLRDVQVLVLRHSGLSYKEIAAALEIATGSVGTLLARAEARFEVMYQGGGNAPTR